MRGLNKPDPIMFDIMRAKIAGHFDTIEAEGLSELLKTPSLDLLKRVQNMSDERRRLYLARLGRLRAEPTSLSGEPFKKKRGRTKLS